MLYLIAQPTRKNPELLPRYEELYPPSGRGHGTPQETRTEGKKMSGDEILAELMKRS